MRSVCVDIRALCASAHPSVRVERLSVHVHVAPLRFGSHHHAAAYDQKVYVCAPPPSLQVYARVVWPRSRIRRDGDVLNPPCPRFRHVLLISIPTRASRPFHLPPEIRFYISPWNLVSLSVPWFSSMSSGCPGSVRAHALRESTLSFCFQHDSPPLRDVHALEQSGPQMQFESVLRVPRCPLSLFELPRSRIRNILSYCSFDSRWRPSHFSRSDFPFELSELSVPMC